MHRGRISISLIVLTIGTIATFQAYWLWKTYKEEKRIFTIRTNVLFRETIFKLQTSKMHLDTAVKIRIQERPDFMNMMDEFKVRSKEGQMEGNNDLPEPDLSNDSSNRFIISLRHDEIKAFPDSIHSDSIHSDSIPPGSIRSDSTHPDSTRSVFYRTVNAKVFHFLEGMDSLQDPITLNELTSRFRTDLAREGITQPFIITITPGSPEGHRPGFFAGGANGSKVTIGFRKPIIYSLDFINLPWFLSRRLFPQILFSLTLVGFTVLSLLLLYRNWQQQRRLTQLKNDFISNITHELKTPIATVSVAVEALKNFNALEDPVKTKEYLDISTNELKRLTLLVDKVLKLSLFERQEIELKIDYFDLKVLVEEVMSSMRLQFEKYQAKLDIVTKGTDFYLRADKLHITSVIFNLLDNALKYSRITPFVQIGLGAEPEQLILSVTDNGVGIPAAFKGRIFEKFFRVPSGDRHDVKGHGLGLSYVSYVLERQGGEITVDSQEGTGSTFTVKIPRGNA
ncbi:sensor histidine kinase [Flavitalea flava]